VVNTSAGSHYGQDDYLLRGCGMGRDATLHLLQQGIRVTEHGRVSWTPFAHTARRSPKPVTARSSGKAIRQAGKSATATIEKLHNLEALPATGFQISCFPHKIHAASAGWTARGHHRRPQGGQVKFAALRLDGQYRQALVRDDRLHPLPAGTDLFELLAAKPSADEVLSRCAAPVDLAGQRLLPPVRAGSIRDFITFEQHVEGSFKGSRDPAFRPGVVRDPDVLLHQPYALIGPHEPVPMPPGCNVFDFELESPPSSARRPEPARRGSGRAHRRLQHLVHLQVSRRTSR